MYPVIHGGDIYQNEVELDFSVNVSPLGIPDGVRDAMAAAIGGCVHYPDIRCESLAEKIAEKEGVSPAQIICGNGASELFLAAVHAKRPARVLIPVPSFYGYEHAAGASGTEIVFYPMKREDGFRLTEAFLPELTNGADMLFLANPNNPVGNTVPDALLDAVCARCRECGITVVLDECFLDFTGKKGFFARHDAAEYPNVLVMKAFTKRYAIPGVRLGYAVTGAQTVAQTIRAQLPEWNVSGIAQAAGIAALGEDAYCARADALVAAERAYLAGALSECGIFVFDGEADFLLLYTKLPLYEELLNRKILVRDCANFRGLGTGFFRIAVKTHAENERLVAAVKAIAAK